MDISNYIVDAFLDVEEHDAGEEGAIAVLLQPLVDVELLHIAVLL